MTSMVHVTDTNGVRSPVAVGAATLMLAIGLTSGAALGLAGGWLMARVAGAPVVAPVPLQPERGFTAAPRGAPPAGCTATGAPGAPGQG
jgi:hypothetical protein